LILLSILFSSAPKRTNNAVILLWVMAMVSMLSGCSIVAAEGEMGMGEVGQPCSPWGSFACNGEGTAELACEEGWYVLIQQCPGGCFLEGEVEPLISVRCDDDSGDSGS